MFICECGNHYKSQGPYEELETSTIKNPKVQNQLMTEAGLEISTPNF